MNSKLHVEIDPAGSFRISSDVFRLASSIRPPGLLGEETAHWRLLFENAGRADGEVGGIPGRIESDVCAVEGLQLRRECFIGDDDRYFCIRLHFKNLRKTSVELDHLYPLSLDSSDSLRVGGQGLVSLQE